VTSHYFIYRND
jgi:hypothetical protein